MTSTDLWYDHHGLINCKVASSSLPSQWLRTLSLQMMANSWFQFKQFRVEQDKTALKVGTDACILGAWAYKVAPARILDIGTGTGLLALMLAQRHQSAQIDALEPEPAAAQQAAENFRQSPWQQRLSMHPLRVQDFLPPHAYELIVCNPPFYPNHLKASSSSRNLALHQDGLSFKELAQACSRLLAPGGNCFILLPPRQAEEFETVALGQGLYPLHRLLVQERLNSPTHRVVTNFAKTTPAATETTTLVIRNEAGDYSPAYQALLKDYYLIF